jgi:hypothetical protein
MKLLESYSLSSSVEIKHKPVLPSQYFPTPADKYITIQNSSGQPAKDYDLWQNVIDLILPHLEKENIKIIQLGQGEIKPLNNVIGLVNQTNFAQSVYILRNALAHVGNDSWACHAAVEVPIISLYGSTSVSVHSPFYFNSRSKFIESHRWGRNCSFNPGENPKSINLICVYDVARAILDTLEIKHEIKGKTVLVGQIYPNQSAEVIPDFIINDPNFLPGQVLNMRADLYFDENLIFNNLAARKYNVVTDRPLNLEYLKQLKQNINSIIYQIDDQHNKEWCQKVIKLGIPLVLISYEDREWLKANVLLDYMDLPLIQQQGRPTLEDLKNKIVKYLNVPAESVNVEDYKNCNYKSSKLILSKGQWYSDISEWRAQNPCDPQNPVGKVKLDNKEWISNQDFFWIHSD